MGETLKADATSGASILAETGLPVLVSGSSPARVAHGILKGDVATSGTVPILLPDLTVEVRAGWQTVRALFFLTIDGPGGFLLTATPSVSGTYRADAVIYSPAGVCYTRTTSPGVAGPVGDALVELNLYIEASEDGVVSFTVARHDDTGVGESTVLTGSSVTIYQE